MIISYIKGDLIRILENMVDEDRISGINRKMYFTHGCNCHAVMGSGIAPKIAEKFPQVAEQDRLVNLLYGKNNRGMLGSVYPVSLSRNVTLFNSYTQFYPGKDLRYEALYQCFEKLNTMCKGGTLIIPKIGAGIAGGDWNKISNLINNATPDTNVMVIEWQS